MIIWFSIILKPFGNDDHSPERLRKETDSTKFGPDPRFTPTSRDLPATPRSLRGRSDGDPNRADSVIRPIL